MVRLARPAPWVCAAALLFCSLLTIPSVCQDLDTHPIFIRGDANVDGRVTLADVFALLGYLHRGQELACPDAADVNDDGRVSGDDMWSLLVVVNRWGTRIVLPAAPYPRAGSDVTVDELGCATVAEGLGAEASPEEAFEGAGAGIAAVEEDDEAENPLAEGAGLDARENVCDPDGFGSELEFIHFAPDEIPVYPGMRSLEADIVFETALGGVEALTLSLFSAPAWVTLESLEFTQKFREDNVTRVGSVRTFADPRAEGHLASSIAFDVATGETTLPETTLVTIARLKFRVEDSAPVGESVPVFFRPYPGFDGLPEIPNELVSEGHARIHERCGLTLRVVSRDQLFLRGDADRNGRINLSDAVGVLRYLFSGRVSVLPCLDAADADDDGAVEVSDALYLARFLFQLGPAPLPPFPRPGEDSELPDEISCGDA